MHDPARRTSRPSCLLLAVDVEGKEITTIEGLARQGRLHPVQEAFINHHAIQCGFCSPGMILTAKALLTKTRTRPKSRYAALFPETYAGARATRKSWKR